MNLLLKSLILAAIGCSMTQVSAMHKKPAKKAAQPVNQIGKFLRDKYGCQPAQQDKSAEKPAENAPSKDGK